MSRVRKSKPVALRRNLLREEPSLSAESSEDPVIYVVGYVRVSDIKSARGEISIPDQKARIRAFCDDMNYHLVCFYEDRARTATTDNRKAFQKMISDIESGRVVVSYIVGYDTSRLFRNRTDLGNYDRRMAEFGVKFISSSQRFSNDVSGLMSRNIIAEIDQYIPMVTSIRVKEAQLALARQGFWPGGRPCYGIETYVVERFGKKVRRKLRPCLNEVNVVKTIFKLCLSGDAESGPMGSQRIAEWLISKSIKTRSGSYFSYTTIHHMLTNPSYIGKYFWNFDAKIRPFVEGDEDKEVFVFELEAIIDEEEFDRVQEKLKSQDPKKGGDTRVYTSSLLLRELAYCSCGSMLGLSTGTGRDGIQRRYYLCNQRKKTGKLTCSAGRVNEDVLDEIVVDAIKATVLDGERVGRLLEAWTEREAQIYAEQFQKGAEAQKRAERTSREVQRLLQLAMGDDDLVTDPVFRKELSRARETAALARKELAEIASRECTRHEITPDRIAIFTEHLHDMLSGDDQEKIKMYLRSLISEVIVSDQEIRVVGNQSVLQDLINNGPTQIEAESFSGEETAVRIHMDGWRSRQDSNLRPSA